MGKTDVIDYAEICNHAKRKRECPACAEIAALRAENARLRELVKESNRVFVEIKEGMKEHSGDPDQECPYCMGELLDYEKDLLAELGKNCD
jgi:hypothetical protein